MMMSSASGQARAISHEVQAPPPSTAATSPSLATPRRQDTIVTCAMRRIRAGLAQHDASNTQQRTRAYEAVRARLDARYLVSRRGYGPGGGVKMAWVPMRRQMTWACPAIRSWP